MERAYFTSLHICCPSAFYVAHFPTFFLYIVEVIYERWCGLTGVAGI